MKSPYEPFPCLNNTNYKITFPSLILLQDSIQMIIVFIFLYFFYRDVVDSKHCICGDLWLVFAGQHRSNLDDV